MTDIYLFYILLKYYFHQDKIMLFQQIKEYLINENPILIKFLQIFLLTQYQWDDSFSSEEINEINDLLFNFEIDHPKSSFKVGCGSVAYVYFKDNTKKIVIKELIEDIENKINASYSRLSKYVSLTKYFNYNMIEEDSISIYKNILLEQLDLTKEVNNTKNFKEIFKNTSLVEIPKILSYSKNKIEMEYIEGVRLSQFIKKYPDKKNDAIILLFSSLYHMINSNIIHGDLHEGNFLFELKDSHVIIKFLDFGLVNKLDNNLKKIINNYLFHHNLENRIKFYYEITNKKNLFRILGNSI